MRSRMKNDNLNLKVTVAATGPSQELVISELVDFGFTGFEQKEERLEAWIPIARMPDDRLQEVTSCLAAITGSPVITAVEQIADRNWNEEWEKSIRPVQAGIFHIHPSWTKEPAPEGFVPICIDPKMAFGTGYHETTRLMLKLLTGYIPNAGRVLDAGTGTGILAIAAIKLGAGHAVAVDNDPWSIANAEENRSANNVGDKLELREGSIDTVKPEERFHLILANINRNILLEMSCHLSRLLEPGGSLLLSGILHQDEEALLSSPCFSALHHAETIREGDWSAMALRNYS